ncbi:hypothetical protein L1987_11180 [Smallanthus sonchifolius]|uniref:Uncharacterized protein n=1 Tax=Smallanthus sonchifolius TaxID=185202 RepID=A0ACB9JCB2_9ASTR|nr:hypothetical protein L1987_11180 [Smallanthus sonchifolius]
MIKVCSFIWVLLCDFASSSFRHLIEHLAGSRIDDTLEKSLGPPVGFNEQEEDKSEFAFGFQFQMKEEDFITYKDSIKFKEKSKDSVTDASGCDEIQELQEKNSINFEEKSKEDSVTDASGCDEIEELQEKNASVCDEIQELQEKIELNLGENGVLKTKQDNWLGEFFMRNDSFCYGFNLSQESESDSVDYHPESDHSGDGFFSICPQDVDSVTEPELEILMTSFPEEIDDDYIELEPNLEKEPQSSDSNGKPESDFFFENSLESEAEPMKSWEFDSDEEEDDADVVLEHQELIDQMKMELMNARTGGLPTILEECETPRVKEDYKPLQINEKLEHRDQMAEIQKFYKSYTEKMRKLDVLNYQTLQAINFLRMKHPDQTNTEENTSLSVIKSVLLPSLWPCKLRRIYADPTLKSITELHKDLEIVYVGHACLSWEVLHWQYKKAKELQLYDPQGYRSYNQTAIEFQQFHVLLRRFTEDELFQGPRVQNYTKQRCTLRGLLQVPAIRDDNLKEKKARKKEDGDAVSISRMTKMIKESMMVFWEFLHTDKDTTNLFLTIILQGSKAHLQDLADSDLFMEIKTIHQKKERRLKDMLRTGNCIVRKFQKQEETILDQHMFVSQVELRLGDSCIPDSGARSRMTVLYG